ncbi:MAG: hypothetical protein WAW80_01190 [Candidatus Saccharimonadales bacterium]
MIELIYDDLAIEQIAKKQFGLKLEIDKIILRQVPVSRTATTTIFLTTKKQLFAYISAQSTMTLGDVKKIVSRMGLKPELFVPPKGQPSYFDDIGRRHVRAVFPGRSNILPSDLVYYRTLAPYNPALIQIREIPSGEICQYDADAHGNWRVAVKFAYRRIKTS